MARTVTCFILDVSPGMAEEVYDEETGRTVSKLDLCKEYVCRKIAPMVQSGRKTEHAGVLTFGGATDNPFFARSENEGPEASAHDPQDYVGVASIFPPQQARPQMLGVINSIQVGQFNGNPMAALVVLEELLDQHTTDGTQGRSTRNWKKEVVVLTYAQAKVKQVGWEVVLEGVRNRSILLKIM
ncbi:hypothetical protein QFC24_005058 [Naganishia onofrii]|uniref:Uncharacterized protein n=1 Tax=Naganishia onofrii TaxID=1851511 RepID=A0ACC2XCS5_9TREE|nr:hypothetical protein QFC24_005058 [Naganishia onofrii]